MDKLKRASCTLISPVIFLIIGSLLAAYLESDYRRSVRFLIKLFNGDKIHFFGKDFHLFPGLVFVLSFGCLAVVIFFTLKEHSLVVWIKQFLITVCVFVLVTLLVIFIDSYMLIIECTACDDGVRKLNTWEISYDFYFTAANISCIMYLTVKSILHKRNLSKQSAR